MKYGPQTAQIEALLARLATVTDAEATALHDARYAAWCVVRYERDDAWSAARSAAWYVARSAAWSAAWSAARGAARYDARDAIAALAVRDLICDEGFTQADYDLLTSPWRIVIGPIHSDDNNNRKGS